MAIAVHISPRRDGLTGLRRRPAKTLICI